MSITINQTKILVAGAFGAFTTTLLVASGGLSGKFISLASIFSIGGWVAANVVIDARADKRIHEIEQKLSLELGKIAELKHESAENFEKLQLSKSYLVEAERKNTQLVNEVATIQQALEATRQTLQISEAERANLAGLASKLQQSFQQLQESFQHLQQESKEDAETIQKLEHDLELLQKDFEEDVQAEAEVLAQTLFKEARSNEIDRIFNEHDSIVGQLVYLVGEMDKNSSMIVERHSSHRSFIENLTNEYRQTLKRLYLSASEERDKYLEQIDLLNITIGNLQASLNAALNKELVEAELVDARFNPDLDLGNALCREIFYQFKIPLRFYHAYTSEDGVFHGGFMLNKGADREALASRLHESAEALATALRLYKIESIAPADVLEGIEVRARRNRPQPVSEDAIYRLMEPSKNCCQILRDAMNHRKGGKPTLRVMSGTGGGKGIVVKAFLADWVKSMPGEVWLSDPMDGSSEDYWEVPKAAKSAREGSKLLGEFSSEFYARKNKNSEHKGVLILGVFDEFDKQHPDDDKEKVQEIWTAIRHHDMRLVLMGQSSEVGVNGWTWDAMKNCALLFVGNAITTAIKQAKNIGLSGATKRQIERNYDTIKLYLEDKNKGLGSDVMYRVALLIVDDTFKFLELPPAVKVAIENETSTIVSNPWESLISTDSSISLASDNPLETALKARICPGCKGKLRKNGQRLRCENREHTKDMGAKTFPLID